MSRPIINTYDQLVAAGGGVAIIVAYAGTRDKHVSGWHVYRIGPLGGRIVTDQKGHWTDNGWKLFSLFEFSGTFHDKRKGALLQAQEWVKQQGWYDGPWVRNRQRDFVPAEIQKRFPIRREAEKELREEK